MAVKILGGDTLAGVDVDSTPKAVRVIQTGPRDGGELLIDRFLNRPSVGGYFSCGGASTTALAGALTNSTHTAIRLMPYSDRVMRILQWDVHLITTATNVSADIAGSLVFQRFSGGTPVGGTEKTSGINSMDQSVGETSHCTVFDDSGGAAPTTTTIDFGTIVARFLKGLEGVAAAATTSYGQQVGLFQRRLIVPNHAFPVILMPGDGLAMRTVVAHPVGSSASWMYAYTIWWEERKDENAVEEEV